MTYAYDGRNLLTGYTQSGDTVSSATYGYDAKGQKTDESVTYGSGAEAFTKTLHYGYEANGLKKSLTYPDGTVQTSTYDQNRLAMSADGHFPVDGALCEIWVSHKSFRWATRRVDRTRNRAMR